METEKKGSGEEGEPPRSVRKEGGMHVQFFFLFLVASLVGSDGRLLSLLTRMPVIIVAV